MVDVAVPLKPHWCEYRCVTDCALMDHLLISSSQADCMDERIT